MKRLFPIPFKIALIILCLYLFSFLVNYLSVKLAFYYGLNLLLLLVAAIVVIYDYGREGKFFSPIVVFSLVYFLFLIVGALGYRILKGAELGDQVITLVTLGLLSFLLGVKSVNIRSRHSETVMSDFLVVKTRRSGILFLLTFVALVASFLYFVRGGGIPMLAENINVARVQIQVGSGYLRIFMLSLPIISLIYLLCGLWSGSKSDIITAWVLIFIRMAIALLAGYRGRAFFPIFSAFILYYLVKGKNPPLIILTACIVLGFLSVSFLGAYRRGWYSAYGIFKELVIILTTRAEALRLVLSRFPEKSPFLGFSVFTGDLIKLLPGAQSSYIVSLKYSLLGSNTTMPELSGYTLGIIGELFAALGVGGVLIGMFLIGVLLQLLYVYGAKSNNPIIVVAYVVTLVHFVNAITAGLGTKMPHLAIAFFWIGVFYVYFLYEKSRLSSRRNKLS